MFLLHSYLTLKWQICWILSSSLLCSFYGEIPNCKGSISSLKWDGELLDVLFIPVYSTFLFNDFVLESLSLLLWLEYKVLVHVWGFIEPFIRFGSNLETRRLSLRKVIIVELVIIRKIKPFIWPFLGLTEIIQVDKHEKWKPIFVA